MTPAPNNRRYIKIYKTSTDTIFLNQLARILRRGLLIIDDMIIPYEKISEDYKIIHFPLILIDYSLLFGSESVKFKYT